MRRGAPHEARDTPSPSAFCAAAWRRGGVATEGRGDRGDGRPRLTRRCSGVGVPWIAPLDSQAKNKPARRPGWLQRVSAAAARGAWIHAKVDLWLRRPANRGIVAVLVLTLTVLAVIRSRSIGDHHGYDARSTGLGTSFGRL